MVCGYGGGLCTGVGCYLTRRNDPGDFDPRACWCGAMWTGSFIFCVGASVNR